MIPQFGSAASRKFSVENLAICLTNLTIGRTAQRVRCKMADVTGPISTLPGARHSVPKGQTCDRRGNRPAVARIPGETDSFGCGLIDMYQECLDRNIAWKDSPQTAERLKGIANGTEAAPAPPSEASSCELLNRRPASDRRRTPVPAAREKNKYAYRHDGLKELFN
jgi:hypothetical protein